MWRWYRFTTSFRYLKHLDTPTTHYSPDRLITGYHRCPGYYGPCGINYPIRFRLVTLEVRRIARKADRSSRDHQGCANKYCFSSFSISAALIKSSEFQVVEGRLIPKSASLTKPRIPCEILFSIEKKKRSTAVDR